MSREGILVVDKGSTNVKVVLFDLKGTELVSSSKPCQNPSAPRQGWCEQDMDNIWNAVVLAIQEILSQIDRPSEIIGVSVTGQGSGIYTVDKNGNPARPAILSLDLRAAEIVEKWNKDGKAKWYFEHTNDEVVSRHPIAILAWIKQYEPDIYKKISKIFFSKDWVKYKLTGKFSTDISDAGPAGILNVETMNYFREAFETMEIEEMNSALPDLIPSYEQAGSITSEAAHITGLLEGTPVFSGVHDMMACPLGVGTLDRNQVICVSGTWGMNFISSQERGATFSFPHAIPGYFVTGRCDGNSGSVQERMLKILCPKAEIEKTGKSIYQYAQELAINRPKSRLLFHPYMFGGLYNSDACAGFYGLRDWHTKGDMVKALFEGIAFGHYFNIKTIEGNEFFTTIWFAGGGSKNKYLCQLLADITGLTVKTAITSQLTARGAALAALIGLGKIKNFEEASILVDVKKQYEPIKENREFYQKKFEIYCELMTVLTPIWEKMKSLNHY